MSAVPQSVAITPSVFASSSGAAKPAKPEHEAFGFADFLDIINPLQHIPVVSTLYRRLTGDKMSATAEIAGGALFGGVLGLVSSLADVVWTQATGKDFGSSVMAWLGFDDKRSPIQLAKAAPAPAQQLALAKIAPMADLQIGAPTAQLAQVDVAPLANPRGLAEDLPRASEFVPDLPALIDAMEKQGVDPAVALRAAAAYRNAIEIRDLPGLLAAPAF